MNCPVRTEPFPDEGHNQNPPELSPELTTRRSLNTPRGEHGAQNIHLRDGSHAPEKDIYPDDAMESGVGEGGPKGVAVPEGASARSRRIRSVGRAMLERTVSGRDSSVPPSDRKPGYPLIKSKLARLKHAVVKYTKFIGPGFMVAVAYIDPGTCP
jgi:metal iron transporter